MRRHDEAVQLSEEQAVTADAGLKAMIRVGRPFLDYVLSGLADAGYRDICLVIGPEHEAVRDYYAAQTLQRISLSYTVQLEARGTADAVTAAEPFVANDDFLVMNADNLYPVEVLRTLRSFEEPGTVLFDRAELVRNSNIPAERVRSYAYAAVHDEYLVSLIEKPGPGDKISPDALVSMNIWRFTPTIFEHCRAIAPSSRGEYELPTAISRAIQHGIRFRVAQSSLGVLDLSQRSDVPAVAARLDGNEVRL